jgi:hypothetical protein
MYNNKGHFIKILMEVFGLYAINLFLNSWRNFAISSLDNAINLIEE